MNLIKEKETMGLYDGATVHNENVHIKIAMELRKFMEILEIITSRTFPSSGYTTTNEQTKTMREYKPRHWQAGHFSCFLIVQTLFIIFSLLNKHYFSGYSSSVSF